MSEHFFHLEKKKGIAIVIIDRPQRSNAFNEAMWNEFEETTEKLAKNLPRVVILTGTGGIFSAGFDVNPDNPMIADAMKAISSGKRLPIEKLVGRMREVVDRFSSLPVPIIAAINGKAYGGGAELAIRCDLRLIEPDGVICFSELRLGLMPDWGGCAVLPRLVGPAHAADLILTARKVLAKEALSMGLVNRISSSNQVLYEAIELADQIAGNGPSAVQSALEVIRSSRSLSLSESLDMEMEKAISLIESGECFHGISAFLSNKTPEFPEILPDISPDNLLNISAK